MLLQLTRLLVLLQVLMCVSCTDALELEHNEEINGDITLTCKEGLDSEVATFLHGGTSVATDKSSYTFTINSTTEGEYTCMSDGATSDRVVFIGKW